MGPAILIMAFTMLVCFVIVYKLVKARQASHWPSVEGVVIKSGTVAKEQSHAQEGTTVKTLAALTYEYTVAPNKYRNTQIRAGDKFGVAPGPEILNRFPKDAKVPVFYNPKAPQESVLIKQLPYSVAGAWAGAVTLFMAGVGASLMFTNLDTEMEALRRIFPPKAEPQGVIFFGLGTLLMSYLMWDNWRQANRAQRWPTVEGTVVVSKAESHSLHAGPGSRGTRTRVYEPLVEYSYVVEGIEYHSAQVSFGAQVSSADKKEAEARAAKYPAGAKVPVHYNPEHPTVSVLETGVAFQALSAVILVVFLGLMVFFAGVGR